MIAAMMVTSLVAGFMLLVFASFHDLGSLFFAWLDRRQEYQLEELKIRRLEAIAKLDEPSRKVLIDSMPDWLDPEDQAELEAWKAARSEVIKTGK